MCGIAGIWGDVTAERLKAMADAVRHRGPDDEGFWTSPGADVGLAHRRLSVIDLEGGQQPISNEDGRVVTVFNGEIYNYRELRHSLVSRGHRFATQSDTEVIVHLYEECGTDFVTELRGMFALALWDDKEQQLVLVRDRVGKKPLYYSEKAEEFLFGSEIKALVAGTGVPLETDEQALADYLGWGGIHAPATIYRQVRAVEPGEALVVRARKVARRWKYWHLRMHPKVKLTREEAVERIDGLVRDAVDLRLRSDVPVGAFLSGGIDSGIVTALAAQQYPGKLTTITIGFEDGEFDERPLARLVAQRYDTDHHEVVIHPQVARDLPKIAAAYDQPFGDSSGVPSYYVAEAARQFVKVVLNGDGGDEVFAGYRRCVAGRINRLLWWADGARCRPAWGLLARLMPVPRRVRSGYAFAHRLVRGLAQDPVQRYLSWSVDVLTEQEKRAWCNPGSRVSGAGAAQDVPNWLAGTKPSDRLARAYLDQFRDSGPMDRMLGADFAGVLPHDLLVKMDIACMAHGLEARSPLLDHVLIDVVSRFPEATKLPGFETKPLLRRLSRRYVPPEVQAAPKCGFEIPVVRWLRGELRPLCEDIMLSRNGLLCQILQRSALERMLRGEDGVDPGRWGRRMWGMLMLGIWDAYVRPRWQTSGAL